MWIENLTVAQLRTRNARRSGRQRDLVERRRRRREKSGAHGWFGSYLTAYDTGLNGGYGIFTNNETEGEWENIYASGFNDSGIYLGACPECEARDRPRDDGIQRARLLGLELRRQLIIENSMFNHNTTGIAPNSENPGDGPPPQNGACEHRKLTTRETGEVRNCRAVSSSTNIAHCTIIRNNLSHRKQRPQRSRPTLHGRRPVGRRRRAPGRLRRPGRTQHDHEQPHRRRARVRVPEPVPAERSQKRRPHDPLPNAGNKIADNTFAGNGYLDGPSSAKANRTPATWRSRVASSARRHSTNNCVSGNSMPDGSVPGETSKERGAARTKPPRTPVRPGVPGIPARSCRRIRRPRRRSNRVGAAGAADDAEPVRRSADEPAVPVSARSDAPAGHLLQPPPPFGAAASFQAPACRGARRCAGQRLRSARRAPRSCGRVVARSRGREQHDPARPASARARRDRARSMSRGLERALRRATPASRAAAEQARARSRARRSTRASRAASARASAA